jgi:hypothetical protein
MSPRRVPLVATVLVAALMLVLGSVGTATAGGLTTKAVKKIAAKVVTKKASSLSVASAQTATTAASAANADKLGGQPPAAYQDTALVSTTVVSSATTSVTIPISLAPGSYQVGVNAYFNRTTTAPASKLSCYLNRARSGANPAYFAEASSYVAAGDSAGVTGTGIVTVQAGDSLSFLCQTPSSVFTTAPGEPIQTWAIPLDAVSTLPAA